METEKISFLNKDVHMWVVLAILWVVILCIGVLYYYLSSTKEYSYQFSIDNPNGEIMEFSYGSKPAFAEAGYFKEVKDEFISNNVTFIEIDLSKMDLRYYEEGIVVKEAKVLAKGKEGSWWETPPGLYKALDKIRKHKSNFGPVYMPWNIQFHGNFFIHGWPTYLSGAPAKSPYSGGCIRLSVEDAKELYGMTPIGTPILVYEDKFSSVNGEYDMNIPGIKADNFLVADLNNNFVFTERGRNEEIKLGDLSHLMVALVATEYIKIDNDVYVAERHLVDTRVPRLKPGRLYSVHNLLFPLLRESSNEAAEALASYLGRSRFLKLMNDKARSLGMKDTKFSDISIDSDNVSTSEDLFHLTKYLNSYRGFIFDIKEGRINSSVYGNPSFSALKNYNSLESDDVLIPNQLFVVETQFANKTRPVAFIIINSENSSNKEIVEDIKTYISSTYALAIDELGKSEKDIIDEPEYEQGAMLIESLD